MIHLIVGNTGSGKTTYSNSLRKITGGVIFSIDDWNSTLFLEDKTPEDGLDWFLNRIERVETMILSLIDQLQLSKVDVILDLGFSKFDHRQKFRSIFDKLEYAYHMHFLDIPSETRLDRVMHRNKVKGETYAFEVSKENFDFMESWFEIPNETELDGATIIGE